MCTFMQRISFKVYLFLVLYSRLCICMKQREDGICYKYAKLSEGNSTAIAFCCSGYAELKRNKLTPFCVPTCQPDCLIGECVAPNTCSKVNGFEMSTVKNTMKYSVLHVPEFHKKSLTQRSKRYMHINGLCSFECENGYCVGDDKCKCDNGYTLSEDDPSLCLPVCTKECINAACVGPDFCKCHDNYEINLNRLNECLPICNPPCRNGTCIAPDTCQCFEGYSKENIINKNECRPKCDNCTNGICASPNECKCPFLYKLENGDCQPICEQPCINSTCIEPNKCDCLEGFEKSPNMEKHICQPSCQPECINSECISPNTCRCHESYKKNSTNDTFCEPICEQECKNGRCVMPNQCACNEGYVLNEVTNVCSPICHPPCINSDCMSPDNCECHKGYFKSSMNNNSHICESKIISCKKKLQNGLKAINKSSCYEFDDVVKTFDQQCNIEFTNTSCYDEFCKANGSLICDMFYSCDIWPNILNSSSIVAHCKWNLFVLDNKNGTTSYNQTDVNIFPNISSIFHEHSFKKNFDSSPCLLCFCPHQEKRQVCPGEKINFKICQCPVDITQQIENAGLLNKVEMMIIVILLAVICGVVILFGIIKLYQRNSYIYNYDVCTSNVEFNNESCLINTGPITQK